MSLLRSGYPTLLKEQKRKREEVEVTVCIAALCEGNIVLGASDRMITAGDIQFEPPTRKTLGLTTSIALMFAGDAALHSEVSGAVRQRIHDQIQADPLAWLTVRGVAEMIVAERNALKLRRAEAAVLQPLGMSADDFLQGRHGLSAELSKAIATDLVGYYLPPTHWIVCGVDSEGAHIYTVYDGELSCQDQVGFAAIGTGGRHAESQLMLGEHARWRTLAETLLLVYSAKKRAEVAPGVGSGTDLFTAGPNVGTLQSIHDSVLARVDEEYVRIREGEATAYARAQVGMEIYVAELQQPPQSEQIADGDAFEDDGDESTVPHEAESGAKADD